MEKYTITKIYFEGTESLNRYYIFSFLSFKEGDTLTPPELQRRLEDSRRSMRTQWYFQAEFETKYHSDGQVEIFVLLEPSPKRLGFMGGTADEHSLYIGFTGERKSPGSAFRSLIGKSSGISWYFPRLGNSLFGLN
ncbi:MAG: POTRA domain-containing protein, partial [Spirochaetota bacterium]